MKPIDHIYRNISPLMIILIMSTVFFCFSPAVNNGFVWDDEFNLIENSAYKGLSWNHLSWMWTTFHDGNYHPLCWMTLGMDYALWRMNPAGYHLTNLILHGLNAVLCYLLIIDMLRRSIKEYTNTSFNLLASASIGALFFAIHPLRVESVAWISTRGDTLCGFFYFLTILCYLKMSEGESGSIKTKWYWLSLVFYLCSLLSRAWGITLPVILFILDVYPLRRWIWGKHWWQFNKKILLEKIPFAFLALLAGIAALAAKKSSMLSVAQHTIVDRLFQAAYGLCFYLYKILVPIRLSPLYQLRDFNLAEPQYILSAVIVLGITLGLLLLRQRWPWAITAWFCYSIIVSPLLGFAQSGPQVVADRYTYFSSLPFAVLVGAGFFRLSLLYQNKNITRRSWLVLVTLISSGLILFGVLSHRQTGIWHDSRSLWRRVLTFDPNNYIAFNNIGVELQIVGHLAEAIEHYRQSLKIKPDYFDAHNNLGFALSQRKQFDQAIKHYRQAIKINPDFAKAHNNLGNVFYQEGRFDQAIKHYRQAIKIIPNFADAHNNLGSALFRKGLENEAVEQYLKALQIMPDHALALENLNKIKMFQKQKH